LTWIAKQAKIESSTKARHEAKGKIKKVPEGYQQVMPHLIVKGAAQFLDSMVTDHLGEVTMPIHDWTRVTAGTFHNFHFLWMASLCNALNAGRLPKSCFAMVEQVVGQPEADVVALQTAEDGDLADGGGGTATAAEPRTTFVLPAEEELWYARKANRVAVHHRLGVVLAVLEVVSPGNKSSQHAIRSFAEKAADLVWKGVGLLVVDLFPPGPRDPQGIHPLIWDEISPRPFSLPSAKPLTLAAYRCEPVKTAYVEPVAVGDRLPAMPLFLRDEWHVETPLEETYQATWDELPRQIKRLFDGGD
jgi:hypothetical protein